MLPGRLITIRDLSSTRFWLVLSFGLFINACTSLPVDYPRSESHVLTETKGVRLDSVIRPKLEGHEDQSGALLLSSGLDAFLARLVLAETADSSLDIQYYIWHGDTTGKLLINALIKAAERGVRVRLLLDDIGTAANDKALLMMDDHPNIEVRLFNPIAHRSARTLGMIGDLSRVNRRMHNKSFTADNLAAIVGGRNIGDEYFEADGNLEFTDLDVLLIGKVVDQVSVSFDQYWNSSVVYPITVLSQIRPSAEETQAAGERIEEFNRSQRAAPYLDALESSSFAQALRDGTLSFSFGDAHMVYDDPAKINADDEDKSTLLITQLSAQFQSVRSELLLVSPYFVPGDEGVAALKKQVERGVKVRIVTNSLAATDVPMVHAGYARYRRPLLEAGIELYEVKPTASAREDQPGRDPKREKGAAQGLTGSSRASLHAKTLVFDRRSVFIGSMNLDPRSVFTNTEIGVVVDNPELVGQGIDNIDKNLPDGTYQVVLVEAGAGIEWLDSQNGVEIRHTREPLTSGWQRFKVWFYSLLPIEPLL